jgi:hypothetical protein
MSGTCPIGQHNGPNREKVPRIETLPMRIGLKQSNPEAGREKLYQM